MTHPVPPWDKMIQSRDRSTQKKRDKSGAGRIISVATAFFVP